VRNAEFNDVRLVPVYDAAFGWGPDDDFFLSVIEERPRSRVLDLGCGTGRFTLAMAAAGHTVTGVDPAPASLTAARAKPGADAVTWIDGTSADLPADAFDQAIMTSHVAQFFTDDASWAGLLADLHRALVAGGRVVFDTRDPRDRGWERWNPAETRRRVALPDGRTITMWGEVLDVTGDCVESRIHYEFPSGEEVVSSTVLRFPSEDEVRSSLADAGFTVESIYGGWHRQPVGGGDGELLVIART
jgi:SAM-dependent methyltransferase